MTWIDYFMTKCQDTPFVYFLGHETLSSTVKGSELEERGFTGKTGTVLGCYKFRVSRERWSSFKEYLINIWSMSS